MNSKFYVSLEAARLLKEKGYNEVVEYYYDTLGELNEVRSIFQNSVADNSFLHRFGDYYAAPTKAEAIDWLESKGMRINIIYDWLECGWYFSIINGSPTVKNITELKVSDSVFYKTRLEAEEAAIIKALELL